MFVRLGLALGLMMSLWSCEHPSTDTTPTNAPTSIPFTIQELSDTAYPDNPDIGYRASKYATEWFEGGTLTQLDSVLFDLSFYTNDQDTITLSALPLHTWVPLLPERLRGDAYLSRLSLINQEWNRNQVAFRGKEFQSTNSKVVRVDLARNCLQSYLWEIIVYTQENGKETPLAHGWFDFPNSVYDRLFEDNNQLPFDSLRHCLAQWQDPASQPIDRERLRQVVADHPIQFADSSDAMYPLAQARKKKFKEIIVPARFATMRDLQTDSTTFATFTPPGFYNRADPRSTELGRFQRLTDAYWRTVQVAGVAQQDLQELELVFEDASALRETHVVLGGWRRDNLPRFSAGDANLGWKYSMGFGNHTFYESYDKHQQVHSTNNPHYAYLTDAEHRWLDSHRLGIDGPILHWDDVVPNRLHVWLLSFERHALVGHYILDVQKPAAE